ncbi:MAG: hypothetical protein F6K24_48800 [Okeania sp. SIO2D1]|nr:hypothetical protein [Okeania sp. SIO2D1]
MEINKEDYKVWYEPETATVSFQGLLREAGIADYEPIEELLKSVITSEPETITLNIRKLKFLNSSGMTILSRFVLSLRKKKSIQLIVNGSQSTPWQKKSLGNWQRLMPGLKMELE